MFLPTALAPIFTSAGAVAATLRDLTVAEFAVLAQIRAWVKTADKELPTVEAAFAALNPTMIFAEFEKLWHLATAELATVATAEQSALAPLAAELPPPSPVPAPAIVAEPPATPAACPAPCCAAVPATLETPATPPAP